jgi:hypothetical protein
MQCWHAITSLSMSDVPVDFVFVLDATQSMSEAIGAARDKMNSIAAALLRKYPTGFSFKFSAVGYRDEIEDGIASEKFDFDSSADALRVWLANLEALGGGDYCEDWVNAMELIFQLSWRDHALRCVFWIADAPAHGNLYHLLIPSIIGNCDNHPDREPFLAPYFAKMAKMNMLFIGLDLGVASYTYVIAEQIYLRLGGPSFTFARFSTETDDESNGLAQELEARALTLVDQTISQTCTFALGQEPPDPALNSRVPTPSVTGGADVPVDPALVARLPDYRNISYLAQGVYGVVYRAVRCTDSTAVAIKHMEFTDDSFCKFFQREVSALQALSHPACLPYISSTEWPSDGILITPLQICGTLDTALKLEAVETPHDMWPTKKVIIALGIASGMEHIHRRGFVHRDVKTANIFLNDNLEPVIGDFGLATALTGVYPVTGPSMALGTPLHMAPELWCDESVGYSNAVDVYAYGVLLYSMFVRNPELQLDDDRGPAGAPRLFLPRIQRGARFLRKATINDAYWELITACWNGSPANRPTFRMIVDGMVRNIDKFLLDGADRAEVQSYIAKMPPIP